MAKKQLEFQGKGFKAQPVIFGGSLLKGNARDKRPISTKLPIHLILRATKSTLRIPRVYVKVNETVVDAAKKYGFKIYKFANVGIHLHLVLRVSNRRLWAKFIREITGRIATLVQGLKGPQASAEKFWLFKPFTRIVAGWRKAYRAACNYVYFNAMEGEGNIKRSEVKSFREYCQLFMGD